MAAVAVTAGCAEATGDGAPGVATSPRTLAGTAAPTEVVAATDTSDPCAHAGHDLHHWSPEFADEMVVDGCPWPYAGFTVAPGDGAPSADLDGAPFEGRLYADLTAMVAELDLGLCQFGNLPDPGLPGFVFGFQYTAARPGCPAAAGAVTMAVAEYSTRGLRDAAATDPRSTSTYVLGRWVIGVTGTDDGMAARLGDALVGLGAVPAPPAPS